MTNVTTQLYPEDLYGNNPTNDIVGEVIAVNAPSNPNDYFFTIPSAAPFYKTSLKVWDYNTNQLLVEGIDYVIGHIFIEPIEKIGKVVAGSIRFLKRNITAIVIDYHTLGGPWGFDDTAIARELQLIAINPLIRSWGNIAPLPYSFPPLPHNDTMDDVVGSFELKESLEEIIKTLKDFGEGIPNNHINDKSNPHRVDKSQVGLGNVDNFATATVEQTVAGTAANLFVTPAGTKALIQDMVTLLKVATRVQAEEAVANDVQMTPLRTHQQNTVTVIRPIQTTFWEAGYDLNILDDSYIGVTTASNLITGSALASLVGLVQGTSINSNTEWLNFKSCGKIIYVAKAPIRYSVSWNQLNLLGLVYGSKVIKIGSNDYKVRLLKGRGDGLDTPVIAGVPDSDNSWGSEWNSLMYRVTTPPSTNYLSKEGYLLGEWAKFTSTELGYTNVNGNYSLCQDLAGDNLVIARGNTTVLNFNTATKSAPSTQYGWRPVLELI